MAKVVWDREVDIKNAVNTIPYPPKPSYEDFRPPSRIESDFQRLLAHDVPHVNWTFELIQDWYYVSNSSRATQYYNAGSGTKYARGTGYSVTPISSTSKRLNSVTRYKAGTYVGVLYNAGSVATYYPATETLYKAGTNIGKLYNAGTISTDYYTKA
jgi:hypothetical protein